MSEVEEEFSNLAAGIELIQQGISKFPQGPLDFYVKQHVGAYKALLTTYAKFKIGERVCLVETPDTNNGWRHCKHFLITGAVGTVKAVDYFYQKERLRYDIIFDDESWISTDGIVNKTPDDRKHSFCMPENFLGSLEVDPLEEEVLMLREKLAKLQELLAQ